jgi:hypothetical protein
MQHSNHELCHQLMTPPKDCRLEGTKSLMQHSNHERCHRTDNVTQTLKAGLKFSQTVQVNEPEGRRLLFVFQEVLAEYSAASFANPVMARYLLMLLKQSCKVIVFRQEVTLEYTIAFHAFVPCEALACVCPMICLSGFHSSYRLAL